jgi:hypothetical protein
VLLAMNEWMNKVVATMAMNEGCCHNEWMKVVATIIMVFAMLFSTFAACRLRGVRVAPAMPEEWEIRSHKSENLARAPEKWEIQNQKVRNWRARAGKVRNWRDRAKKMRNSN